MSMQQISMPLYPKQQQEQKNNNNIHFHVPKIYTIKMENNT